MTLSPSSRSVEAIGVKGAQVQAAQLKRCRARSVELFRYVLSLIPVLEVPGCRPRVETVHGCLKTCGSSQNIATRSH